MSDLADRHTYPFNMFYVFNLRMYCVHTAHTYSQMYTRYHTTHTHTIRVVDSHSHTTIICMDIMRCMYNTYTYTRCMPKCMVRTYMRCPLSSMMGLRLLLFSVLILSITYPSRFVPFVEQQVQCNHSQLNIVDPGDLFSFYFWLNSLTICQMLLRYRQRDAVCCCRQPKKKKEFGTIAAAAAAAYWLLSVIEYLIGFFLFVLYLIV